MSLAQRLAAKPRITFIASPPVSTLVFAQEPAAILHDLLVSVAMGNEATMLTKADRTFASALADMLAGDINAANA